MIDELHEINELIAIYVMDKTPQTIWYISRDKGQSLCISFHFESEAIEYLEENPRKKSAGYEVIKVEYFQNYHPTTNMNQSIEALELFIEQAPKNMTPSIWYNSTTDCWVCEIKHTNACEYAETAALAICKAILKAKDIKF